MWRIWERRFGLVFLALGGTIILMVMMRSLSGEIVEWWAVLTGTILIMMGAWMKNSKTKS